MVIDFLVNISYNCTRTGELRLTKNKIQEEKAVLFEKYLGNHLWGFPILLPIVMFIMYIPIYISSKHKNKSVEVNKDKQEITV